MVHTTARVNLANLQALQTFHLPNKTLKSYFCIFFNGRIVRLTLISWVSHRKQRNGTEMGLSLEPYLAHSMPGVGHGDVAIPGGSSRVGRRTEKHSVFFHTDCSQRLPCLPPLCSSLPTPLIQSTLIDVSRQQLINPHAVMLQLRQLGLAPVVLLVQVCIDLSRRMRPRMVQPYHQSCPLPS